MPVRRVSRSRRSFLQKVPAALAASAAVAHSPVSAATFEQAPGGVPDLITADGLGAAQHIIGLNLPVAERESARPIVIRNREHYDAVRKVAIPPETEPAFSLQTSASPSRDVGSAAALAERRRLSHRSRRSSRLSATSRLSRSRRFQHSSPPGK